jgi:thiamine-phosphate pyrophosphorylase
MKSRKELLRNSRLYVVIDKSTLKGKPAAGLAARICGKGADIVQLRDKISSKPEILAEAFKISELARKTGTLFIVNDHLDIAKLSGSDGVHLGQEDLSVSCARRILGRDRIVGVSCHTLAQALAAQKQGADYIGIGPIFSTATKPGVKPIGPKILGKIRSSIRIPFFAIGGIDVKTLPEVAASGASRAAVVRAVCRSGNPCSAARNLRKFLG